MTAGVVTLTYLLAFVMPSNMGRIALLMPIVLAYADRIGLAPGSRGRIGLALAVGFGTFQLSTSILPANVPNLVMAGSIEGSYGLQLGYLLSVAARAGAGHPEGRAADLLHRLDVPRHAQARGASRRRRAVGRRETAGLAAGADVAGLGDGRVHGVSPAWIGLLSACVCLLPKVGFVSGDQFGKEVNFRTAIYVAGILGLAAMVADSGLGASSARRCWPGCRCRRTRRCAAFLVGGLVGVAELCGHRQWRAGAVHAAGRDAGAGLGFSLMAVLMAQVAGYATVVMPYQASPIVVAMGMGQVPARSGLALSLVTALLSFALLVPLDYLWFRLLGMLGS